MFTFFADPAKLEALTPDWLAFRIVSAPAGMGRGVTIDYRLKARGIPLRWRSRVSVWDPPRRFVDEQVGGPYRLWVHEHAFEEERGGTVCRDRVTYAVPGGRLVERFGGRGDPEPGETRVSVVP